MAIDHNLLAIPKPSRKKKRNHVRKKATSERRKLEIECDRLTKILVHNRDGWKCLVDPNHNGVIQCCHILPKGKYPLLRFSLENLLTMCWRCHMEWAHKDPIGFVKWIDARWPDRIMNLWVAAAMKRKIDLKELLIVLESEVAGQAREREKQS